MYKQLSSSPLSRLLAKDKEETEAQKGTVSFDDVINQRTVQLTEKDLQVHRKETDIQFLKIYTCIYHTICIVFIIYHIYYTYIISNVYLCILTHK